MTENLELMTVVNDVYGKLDDIHITNDSKPGDVLALIPKIVGMVLEIYHLITNSDLTKIISILIGLICGKCIADQQLRETIIEMVDVCLPGLLTEIRNLSKSKAFKKRMMYIDGKCRLIFCMGRKERPI